MRSFYGSTTYFNEEHQDSTVRIYTETAIVGIDKNLDIEGVYPFRFRDSLIFNDFSVNAWQDCAFFNVAPVTTNLRPANSLSARFQMGMPIST